jgi:hypothetical protein
LYDNPVGQSELELVTTSVKSDLQVGNYSFPDARASCHSSSIDRSGIIVYAMMAKRYLLVDGNESLHSAHWADWSEANFYNLDPPPTDEHEKLK